MGVLAITTLCPTREAAEEIVSCCLFEGIAAIAEINPKAEVFTLEGGMPKKHVGAQLCIKTNQSMMQRVMEVIKQLQPDAERFTSATPLAVSTETDAWFKERCRGMTAPQPKRATISLAH